MENPSNGSIRLGASLTIPEEGYSDKEIAMDEGDTPFGKCSQCGRECDAVEIDDGYGTVEFWGEKCCHEEKHWVSPCCEAEVIPITAVMPITEDEE